MTSVWLVQRHDWLSRLAELASSYQYDKRVQARAQETGAVRCGQEARRVREWELFPVVIAWSRVWVPASI